jgi:hypothetical protein
MAPGGTGAILIEVTLCRCVVLLVGPGKVVVHPDAQDVIVNGVIDAERRPVDVDGVDRLRA